MTDRDDMAGEPDADGTVHITERDGLNELDAERIYKKYAHTKKALRDMVLASAVLGAAIYLPVGETATTIAGLLFVIPFLRLLAMYYYGWRAVGAPTVSKEMTEAEADRKYGEGEWG